MAISFKDFSAGKPVQNITTPINGARPVSSTPSAYSDAAKSITDIPAKVVDSAKESFGKAQDSYQAASDAFTNQNGKSMGENLATGLSKSVDFAGDASGVIAKPLGEVIGGLTQAFSNLPASGATKELANSKIGGSILDLIAKGGDAAAKLAAEHPEIAKKAEDLNNIIQVLLIGQSPKVAETNLAKDVASKVTEVTGKVANSPVKALDSIKTAVTDITTNIADNTKANGIIQTGKELLDRVPRAIERAKEAAATANERAIKLQNATPEVQSAMKSNIPEHIIDHVVSVDKPTAQAYKKVVDIAADTSKNPLGEAKNPAIVSGDLAAKQYDIIDAQKSKIGQSIGKEVDKLSKTTKVDLTPAQETANSILENNGIKVVQENADPSVIQIDGASSGAGKLDFTQSAFTDAERTKIQQLYKLTTEMGDNATPRQIYDKNKLFGKLKREANMEGIGNIIVTAPDGSKSNLFDVFRDVYMSQLEKSSPKILELNGQYKKFSQLTDDIENSILKGGGNFNATDLANPAEFAKVNLRRIFGEAQSSPVYQVIADNMDKVARQLGYKGAVPKTVAKFAEQIREIYPNIRPKTGFQGGIESAVKSGTGIAKDIINGVSKMGIPNASDQQKALLNLINSVIKSGK